MKRVVLVLLLTFSTVALAEPWQTATDGRFIVETASLADCEPLREVFAVLQDAARDLRQGWGFRLPKTVTVRVYPTLEAYTEATAQPWYVAATANREEMTLHLQRLRVLNERQSLETTLRHELFHLAQPSDWSRWRSEGGAMRFARERPDAESFIRVSGAELNRKLAAASSREEFARAAATAWLWVSQPGLSSAPRRSSSP